MGSLFSSTEWSLDEGCEHQIVGRLISMTLLFLVTFVLALVAVPLLVVRVNFWLYGTRA